MKVLSTLRRTVLAFTLFILCGLGTSTAAMLAESSAYVEAYGLAQKQDSPHLKRTEEIFEHIKLISGRSARSAKLLIIRSSGKPWAIALGDGNIVLSAGALDIIYSHKDVETGDAWMAFVLGHEIAHLANRDMWHHQMHEALAGDPADQALTTLRNNLSSSSMNLDNIKDRELKADEQGFLYAALGGYKINRVLDTPEGGESFLAHWVQQTGTLVDNSHHSVELRTRFLKQRLGELSRQVDLFDYGVKLAHFARYEDASYLVEGFSKLYPSRQSLNNAAYINIQRARKLMQPGLAYRYWIPTLLEGDAGLVVDRGLRAGLPDQAKRLLEDAVNMLEEASAMDTGELVSRINLIAAHFYLGEYFHARAVVEDALLVRPNSLQLQGLRALILLEQEPTIDMWPIASQMLQEVADSPNAPENIVFNYARLLMERKRHGKAKKYLKKLLDKSVSIPLVYREIVCREIGDSEACLQEFTSTKRSKPHWNLPLEIGADIDVAATRKVLRGWAHKQEQIGPVAFDFYINSVGDSVLAIDYRVELITLGSTELGSTFDLVLEAGRPDVVMPLSGDELWSFGPVWSALISEGEVEEVWVAR